MPHKPILLSPNAELRKQSEVFTPDEITSSETQHLVGDLVDTMKQERGIGIAAPQIGVPKRLILVDVGSQTTKAFFNPVITSKSFAKIESEEGCLSVPGVFGIVKRHRSVTVEALDDQGTSVRFRADGLTAIVFQHEIDHLDGVLFIDLVIRYTSHPTL